MSAEPLGWQPGIDWEVYGPNPNAARGTQPGRWTPAFRRPRTGRTDYEAVAYDEDVCVAVVRSRWKPLLWVRMTLKHRQVSR